MGYSYICLSNDASRLYEIIIQQKSTGTHAYLWRLVTHGIFKKKMKKNSIYLNL